jgi:predicted nucleic acid-binding Zn ribbon protein
MAQYLYTDRHNHSQSVTHGMTEEPVITCPDCGEVMHRKPQTFAVNWNGLPPHEADRRNPIVSAMINRELPEQRNYKHE